MCLLRVLRHWMRMYGLEGSTVSTARAISRSTQRTGHQTANACPLTGRQIDKDEQDQCDQASPFQVARSLPVIHPRDWARSLAHELAGVAAVGRVPVGLLKRIVEGVTGGERDGRGAAVAGAGDGAVIEAKVGPDASSCCCCLTPVHVDSAGVHVGNVAKDRIGSCS
jgi:hypothetical protein